MIGKGCRIFLILSAQKTRIESLADAVPVREMRHSPGPKTLEYGLESLSMRRHLILHPEPRPRRGQADHEVVSLKLPQLFPKYLSCYSSHRAPKFAKS